MLRNGFQEETRVCCHLIKNMILSFGFILRHYFANKGLSSQGYGFSSGHVWL